MEYIGGPKKGETLSSDEQSEDKLTPEPTKPTKRKRRTRSPEIRFEKHYGEPLTEQEQDELADLIAQMIFEGMMREAREKADLSGNEGRIRQQNSQPKF